MEILEPLIEKFLAWIKRRKPIIRFLLLSLFFVIAAVVYCLGFFKTFENDHVNEILKDVGRIVFATGVVVAIVKSILFLEIFKDALAKIIFFDKDYLAKQNNLRDIWANVSKAIYKEKFEEISLDIEKAILEKYFPVDHEHYYRYILFEIAIKYHTEKNYIEMSELVTYEARSSSKNQEIKFRTDSIIDLEGESDNVTSYEMEEVRVNQNSHSIAQCFATEYKDNKLHGSLTLTLNGSEQYNIRLKKRKVFALKNSLETKSFTTTRICKQIEAVITYPSDMTLDFYQEGTIEKFVRQPVDMAPLNGYNKVAMRSNSIVFPHQGFRIIFSQRYNFAKSTSS